MWSATSYARLQEVHPELKRRINQLDAMLPSLSLQATQGMRTWSEQDALYALGRTEPGAVVTDAKGGYSAHNFGYAVDLVPEDITPGQPDWNVGHPAWKRLLAAAPSCGLAEGANFRTFPDNPHFYLEELPATPTDPMRTMYMNQGLQAIWDSWNLIGMVADPELGM